MLHFISFTCMFAQGVSYSQPSILFIVHKFPSITETFILGQIDGLIQKGYNISILAQTHQQTDFIHKLVVKHNIIKKTTFIDFYKPVNHTEEFISYIKKFDILYCQYDLIGTIFAKLKQQYNLDSRLVTCIRGGGLEERIQRKKDDYMNLFSVTDLFLPVCHAFANILRKNGCDEKKIVVHHSAIDCNMFKNVIHVPKKKVNLLSISRLKKIKGLDDSITAAIKLIKNGFDLEYHIIGEGELRQDLQKKIDDSGFNNRIKLFGWKDRKAIKKELYKADIFLHTSRRGDGIPNAIMEAFAVGLPVITTKIKGGNQEIVKHHYSGIVVEPQNIKAIMLAILYMVKNPKKRKRFGKNGRQYVKQEHNIIFENKKLDKIFKGLFI
jgi:colanic acid/amylovoran biosynthesis glycosyltransferase